MAIKFVDAFEELQRSFNLFPIISIPSTLHNQLKPEFSSLNPNINSPSSSNFTSSSLSNLNSRPNQIQKNPFVNPPRTSQPNTPNISSPNNSTSSIPANSTNNSIASTAINSTHNLIYSLSPSIKANSMPNITKSSKNNFLNHKQSITPTTSTIPSSSISTGAIPKLIHTPHTTSSPILNNKSSPSPPNSSEADDPPPITQSHSNSSTTSNDSIDIMGDTDNITIIQNTSSSPNQLNTHSPFSPPKKIKLINKIFTPPNPNTDPISPVERKALKMLRSRRKTIMKYLNKKQQINIQLLCI